jgi:hypothetical protein
MAVDTDNEKLALLSLRMPFYTPVPFPADAAITTGDQKHLLWEYPGIDWFGAGFITPSEPGRFLGYYPMESDLAFIQIVADTNMGEPLDPSTRPTFDIMAESPLPKIVASKPAERKAAGQYLIKKTLAYEDGFRASFEYVILVSWSDNGTAQTNYYRFETV